MTLTGTDRGTGSHNTTATTLAVVPASNLAAGSTAVLVVAADNTGTNGVYSITTATDTKGNTWTRRQSPLYDPGAAAAGVQGAIFTTPQNGGALTTGDTITVTFSVTTVAKAWTLMEVAPSGGFAVRYISGGVNAGAASAAPTVTTGSITSANMVIGGLFNEYGTAQVVTGDADSTDGSWSAQQTIDVGLTTSGVGVSSQRKVVTATATQTYNPTLLTSSDVILAWIELAQVEVPACYSAAVRADSPIAYWRLGEASGNPQDSVGTNHVTTVGGTPTYGVTGALTGDSDKAVTLDGVGEYFEVPDAAALDLGDGPLSIECWVKRATQGAGQQELVNKGTNAYSIDINGDTVDRWTLTKVGVAVICESTTTLDMNWHHLVATRNGGATAKLYQDGVDVSGSSSATAFANNASVLGIGRDPAGILPFNGSLDEVALYNTVLSPAQVLVHYEARIASCVPRSTPYPQLLAH